MDTLTVKNNWEAYEYSINGKYIENPEDVKKVRVNGKLFTVKVRKYSVPYSDMGHSYSAYRTDLGVEYKDPFGITTFRSLMDLQKKFKLEVVGYKPKQKA